MIKMKSKEKNPKQWATLSFGGGAEGNDSLFKYNQIEFTWKANVCSTLDWGWGEHGWCILEIISLRITTLHLLSLVDASAKVVIFCY